MTGADAFEPLPLDQQPMWLREMYQVVKVYPPDPETGFAAVLCRWCDMTWPLSLEELTGDSAERAFWLHGIALHGLQHAANGELRLDDDGNPLDDDIGDDEE